MDPIDIHLGVPAVPFRALSGGTPGTSSAEMRAVVAAARQRQATRFNGSATRYNADMSRRQARQFCILDSECSNLLMLSIETSPDLPGWAFLRLAAAVSLPSR
ncbi:MAG: hypothetical protein ACLP9L_19910 [Thermoguttaceae bacterium]